MRRAFLFAIVCAAALAAGCGGSGAAPGDCTNPDTCLSAVRCAPAQMRCGPSGAVQRCRADGTAWDDIAHCTAGQSCSGGQCSPAACTGMTAQCTPDGQLRGCLTNVGQFSDPAPCPIDQVCVG